MPGGPELPEKGGDPVVGRVVEDDLGVSERPGKGAVLSLAGEGLAGLEVHEDVADAIDIPGVDAEAGAAQEVIAGEVVAAIEADGAQEDTLA